VEAGLVTAAGAKANYGVVLKKDGSVDAKATAALRAKLAKKRGKTGIFNFGGTIPELKKRCKAETGLAPPKQPEFPRWVKSGKKAKPATRRKAKAA
jgi:N-methylhydantoinase B